MKKTFLQEKLRIALLVFYFISQVVLAQGLSTNENDYYQAPTTFANEVNLKTDNYVTDNNFNTNDSRGLQRAIDFVSNNGGGKIIIPEGNYSFEGVLLKSNVHIEIDHRAVLRPVANSRDSALLMFLISSENATPIENVSIRGVGGNFTVDIRPVATTRIRIFNYRNVKNILLENVTILDKQTVFASIVFNGVGVGDNVYGTVGGLVKNITVKNADYGYGVMQMQIAKNIFFKDIFGEGGTVLRFEPHNKNLRRPTLNGLEKVIDGMVARNITSKHGNSAIMVSPHFVRNGKLDIRNVTSNSSGFAVRLGKGFTTTEEENLGLTDGHFDPTSIFRDIKVLYSADSAQIRTSHLKHIPCELRFERTFDPTTPGASHNFWTPPAGGVLISDGLSFNFDESHVTMDPEYDPDYNFITNDESASDATCTRRLNRLTESINITEDNFSYSTTDPVLNFETTYEIKKPRDLIVQFLDTSGTLIHSYKEIAYTGRTKNIEIPMAASLIAGSYEVKMHLVPTNETIGNAIVVDTANLTLQANSTPSPSDEITNINGLIILEAENTKSDLDQWIIKTDVPGYTGTGHIEFTGNTQGMGPATSPLEYTFKVTETALYRLIIKSRKRLDGAPADKSNDSFIRLSGDFDESPNAGDNHLDPAKKNILTRNSKFFGGKANEWGWSERIDLGHDNKRFAEYVLKAGETYTFTVSGRSKNYNIDKIVFYNTSQYNLNQARNTAFDAAETIDDGSGGPSLSIDAPIIKENTTNKLTFYPNPTKNNIILNKGIKWKLYSTTGALMNEGEGNTISLSKYTKGLYFLTTENNKSIKIIKE